MRARARRRYRPMTTDSRHDHPIAPNLLVEMTGPAVVDRIWLGDITYIPTEEGWLYLAAILDRCSPDSESGLGHGREIGSNPGSEGLDDGLYASATGAGAYASH